MSVWNGWRVATLCLLAIGAIAMGEAQTVGSKQINAALTSNGDGAERCREIHWPNGFHPEQADLFAHNEIVVHASCQKVFASIVDAQGWPEWYPNSHDVKLLDSPDGKLHEGTRFSWDTFGVHIESWVSSFQTAASAGLAMVLDACLSHVPSLGDERRVSHRDGRSCEGARRSRISRKTAEGYARRARSVASISEQRSEH
jgi:hypothetical protein